MTRLTLAYFALLTGLARPSVGMELTSPVLKPDATIANEQVFNDFGCKGGNVSPALSWTAGPKGTASYAVTIYDPDAPTGSGWWHWVVFNIPATVTRLESNFGSGTTSPKIPGVVQSITDFGKKTYGGPCPPAGAKAHRYVFTVFALKEKTLPLDSDASGAMVGFYLHQNKLAQASFIAKYGR